MIIIYTGTTDPGEPPEGLDVRHWPLLEPNALEVDRHSLLPWVRRASTAVIVYSKHAVRAVEQWPWHTTFVGAIDNWWAVGPKTAAFASERFGVDCRAPSTATFEGLVDELLAHDLPEQLLSLSVAGKTRPLCDALGDETFDWRDEPVYETRSVRWPRQRLEFLDDRADWIALTSRRGVRTLDEQVDLEKLDDVKFAAIGPSTEDALEQRGIRDIVVPESPGKQSLLTAIRDAVPAMEPGKIDLAEE